MKTSTELTNCINPKEILNIQNLKFFVDKLIEDQSIDNFNELINHIINTTYYYFETMYISNPEFFAYRNFQRLFIKKYTVIQNLFNIKQCEKDLTDYLSIFRNTHKYRSNLYQESNECCCGIYNHILIFDIKEKLLADKKLYSKDTIMKYGLFCCMLMKIFYFHANKPFELNNIGWNMYARLIRYVSNFIDIMMNSTLSDGNITTYNYFKKNFINAIIYYLEN